MNFSRAFYFAVLSGLFCVPLHASADVKVLVGTDPARIVAEARRQGVPVMRDAALAARLSELPLDTVIPPDVYRAVAVVLSWVYWMEGREPAEGKSRPE